MAILDINSAVESVRVGLEIVCATYNNTRQPVSNIDRGKVVQVDRPHLYDTAWPFEPSL